MSPRLLTIRYSFALALASCLTAIGCQDQPTLVGSGVVVGESYELRDFSRLTLQDQMDVTVLQGEGFAVEVTADDNLISLVKVVQDGDELRVGLAKPVRLQRATLVCVVHLPELKRVSTQGVTQLHLKTLTTQRLDVEMSGASRVDGEVYGGQLLLHLSGASRAELEGQVETLETSASGACTVNLRGLVATERTSVEVSGACSARVHALGELSMVASGASHIAFTGSPKVIRSDTSGASSIRPE